MEKSMARSLPVIAHTLGKTVTARIQQAFPGVVVREHPEFGWREPLGDVTVLLAGPGRTWVGAPATPPLDWADRLDWVQLPGAGIDTYPKWLREVPRVTTGQGINSAPVAEYVMACMLAYEKGFPKSWVRSREEWRTMTFGSLEGRTLGLVGFGGIGEIVARHALGFGMNVQVVRKSSQPLPEGITRASGLDELVAQADHLVIALPLLDETRGIFDAALLKKLKPGAHLVNVSRGDVIDQEALLRALDEGLIAAASLDVAHPEPPPSGHPLYSHPRVRLTAHSAFSSQNAQANLVKRFLQNLDRYIKGEPMIAELKRLN
jgi:phosphoglycerate dehydrogenase-like enzyme